MSYWKKQIENRIRNLEIEGYNVDWAKKILKGKGITKDLSQLVSLDGELRLLPFLSTDTLHGERIDFYTDGTHLEVWTPMDIDPQKKLVRFINAIAQTFQIEPKCLHQIIYSHWKAPKVIKYEKSYLPKGPVKLVAEILFDIEGFQSEVGQLFMKEIRRREAKFRKENKRGGIVIDISHLTVVDPSFLCNHILENMTPKDAEVLDGVCLRVLDPYDLKGKPKLILVPNVKSDTPLSVNDFPRGEFIKPFHVPFAYALPLISYFEAGGSQQLISRTKEGIFVINGQRVARSFAAEGPVEIVGFMKKPRKLKSVTLKIDEKKAKIPL